MKSAPSALPGEPPNGLTCGIDWARDDHAVAVVDARSRQVHRRVIEYSAAGLRALAGMLGKRGVGEVEIERPDGPVVEALLDAGITVVVISPNQLKNLRGRYGSAGNKDDRFDAFVLADTHLNRVFRGTVGLFAELDSRGGEAGMQDGRIDPAAVAGAGQPGGHASGREPVGAGPGSRSGPGTPG